jgi:hypothetical protein
MICWCEDDRVSDNDDHVLVTQQSAPQSLFPRVPCKVTFTTRMCNQEQRVVSLVR